MPDGLVAVAVVVAVAWGVVVGVGNEDLLAALVRDRLVDRLVVVVIADENGVVEGLAIGLVGARVVRVGGRGRDGHGAGGKNGSGGDGENGLGDHGRCPLVQRLIGSLFSPVTIGHRSLLRFYGSTAEPQLRRPFICRSGKLDARRRTEK